MSSYTLKCMECGRYLDNEETKCPGHTGLLRTEYNSKTLNVTKEKGVFKFFDWLPVSSTIKTDASPVAFKNEKLNKELGLKDLWIAFTGYYPERNAFVRSCSFKELESLPTMARMRDRMDKTIVVASAGNTGRAFAHTSNEVEIRSVIVVPETSKKRIWVPEDKGYSKLITVKGDYSDSISVAEKISAKEGFVPEGGARNIARRDGMGTVMLESAVTIKKIPDHYFQAVGSGTGAISAWEASLRLIGDGRFGDKLPKLHLSQNEPFVPMKKAWDSERRNITKDDLGNAAADIKKVFADVLTNRNPPYSVAGGLYDAMSACGGSIYGVTNKDAKDAEKLWMEFEHAIPDPAASVAFASLLNAIKENKVNVNETILLNMTGGGYNLVPKDEMKQVWPVACVTPSVSDDELNEIINE